MKRVVKHKNWLISPNHKNIMGFGRNNLFLLSLFSKFLAKFRVLFLFKLVKKCEFKIRNGVDFPEFLEIFGSQIKKFFFPYKFLEKSEDLGVLLHVEGHIRGKSVQIVENWLSFEEIFLMVN